MLRKMRYDGERRFLILYPMDKLVEKGTEIVVNNKEDSDMLEELGFKEVAEGKKEIEKLEKKDGEK